MFEPGIGNAPGGRSIDVLASDIGGPAAVCTEVSDERDTSDERRHSRPLMLAIAGWPLWWALGISQLVFVVAAIPLAWRLWTTRRKACPPGFGLWALFLLLVLLSAFALNADATGTMTPTGPGRYFAYALRFSNYVALTVMLLYIGNSSERELPRKSLIAWLGSLGAATIGLGLLSLARPNLSWSSPIWHFLPSFIVDGKVIRLAQVQPVLGDYAPRPAAPFTYTNAWGHATALLIVWLVVAWGVLGSGRRRMVLTGLLIAAAAPIAYSLNRGMWLALALAAFIVAVRLARRANAIFLISGVVLAGVGLLIFALSPLGGLVNQRLHTGHSNEIRTSLASTAVAVAAQSPIIGFGTTRDTIGSDASIAVGPTPDCPKCGGRVIGSTGQYTLLLVAQGFVGLALYVAFLMRSLWAFRTDRSPLGIAGTTVIAMELLFGFFYTALSVPLAIAFCSIGLLWRNAQLRDPSGVRARSRVAAS